MGMSEHTHKTSTGRLDTLSLNSLGFAKPCADTRVVVAMSGGVDSSVCAAMLARAGYEVIGITLQLYDHGAAIKSAKACCAGQDIYDAKRVAEAHGFPHYVLDYESKFSDAVMDDFADTYLKGATPIPCVRCNQTVKFRDLLQVAKDLGADCMATGHYVRREVVGGQVGNKAELHRAVDATKDQSYFLFTTSQEQLDFLRFPLGGQDKSVTRDMAIELGLSVANKPDSQDICFVPTGKYTDVIKKLRPDAANPGEVVHVDGTVLGMHEGIMHYTIGQRRGLNIKDGSGQDPLYVLRLDAAKNQVIVGERKKLLKSRIYLKEVNWLGAGMFEQALDGRKIRVKTRSMRPPVAAKFKAVGNDIVVDLDKPEEGIAPGQACVFYDGETPSRVLGGGWIVRAV
ncbi:MAG: tRNA 2-thiouridine(34) synthase MnmA [Robiginitomaculum sp.]|nr:tRNA 2-thiouridine(34) synthase MnmA [Robiginitomaculum sp.]